MRRIALSFVAVAFFAVVWFFSAQSAHVPLPEMPEGSFQTEAFAAYWRGRIRTVGPERAYIELSTFLEEKAAEDPTFTLSSQHTAAHPFGSALYDEVGAVRGARVCDSRFTYGCMHTLFGRAIETESLTVLPRLAEACRAFGGVEARNCQHGIGHGIVGYIGYEPDQMPLALSLCKVLGNDGILGGCYGGAFMEYNMRSLWFEAEPFRPADERGDVGLCATVNPHAQPACFARLPQWWRQIHHHGSSEQDAFRDMGARCKDVSEHTSALFACASGLGHQAGIGFEGNFSGAAPLCAEAFPDGPARLWCLTGIYRRIAESRNQPHVSLCNVLAQEDVRARCVEFARGSLYERDVFDRQLYAL